ncbi:MAG: glutamate 5-kinase [Gemmatimonadota bacterium]|nr:glutamate 5-kinase [Gemmatimonadota bacterium]
MSALRTAGTSSDRLPGSRLPAAARLVLKIGSSLLVDKATGQLNRAWLESIADELARLQRRGQQVLVVSSGAIALGRPYLGLSRDQRRLEDAQAAAAAGQILLAHAYQDLLATRGIRVAQVLLTLEDTESRRRYLNARNTLETLLKLKVIPVINENDTVATQEIRYGDNDRLGARVAEMTSADVLVLLSDVDGLYDSDPTQNPVARLIPEVRELTPEIEALAGASATEFGSGGMITKLKAARICMNAGCATVIASGKRLFPLQAIEDGAACTWFLPGRTPRQARKQWIAGTLVPRGTVTVDEGAEQALRAGSSLLPVGIVGIAGSFQSGDAVTIRTRAGRDIGRGLVAYSSDEALRILGRRSEELPGLLGYSGRDELIHRDNLALLDA